MLLARRYGDGFVFLVDGDINEIPLRDGDNLAASIDFHLHVHRNRRITNRHQSAVAGDYVVDMDRFLELELFHGSRGAALNEMVLANATCDESTGPVHVSHEQAAENVAHAVCFGWHHCFA